MASYEAGVSTLGITLSYAVEATAGTKPTTASAWKNLHRINEIGEISLDTETIDASALEDYVERSVAGRASTGGKWSVTINLTDQTSKEWADLIAAYKNLSGGKRMWFQVTIPGMEKSDFIVAQPPQQLPSPSFGQNELLTCEIQLAIEEYVGFDTAIVVTEPTGSSS